VYSLPCFGSLQDFRGGDLDRHLALGKGVAPEVDGAGRAFADLSDQLVLAELFEDCHELPGRCLRAGCGPG
jgi:hypothetical protein